MHTGSPRARQIALWALALATIASLSLLASCGFVGADEYDTSVEPWDMPAIEPYNGHSDRAVGSAELDEIAPGQPYGTGTGVDATGVPADERYIIRSVGLRVQVDDVEDALEEVRAAVATADGIVTAIQVSTDDAIPIYRYEATGALADGAPLRGYAVVRVPAENLGAFLESVSGLGAVQRQAEDETDVTQEHIDLSARLENLKAQEERLREFFERAESVEDMLAIEQELGRVRGEIESLTAQIAFLERQASMATVTIELAGKPPVVSPVGSDWGFVRAITQGVRGFVNTINALVVFVMSALPLIIVAVIAWFAGRSILRRRRNTGRQDDSPETETP